MKSIRKSTEFSLRERGSKFFGFLFPCTSFRKFDQQLSELKKQFPDATHHCCAYRIFDESIKEYNTDDGEPSGAAGLPILNALRSHDLVNVGSAVIRYYGGTKLGKPGLIVAYGKTVQECIQKTEIGKIEEFLRIKISYDYPEEREIKQLVRAHQLIEESSSYQERVEKFFLCPVEYENEALSTLKKLNYKGIQFESLGHTFVMK